MTPALRRIDDARGTALVIGAALLVTMADVVPPIQTRYPSSSQHFATRLICPNRCIFGGSPGSRN